MINFTTIVTGNQRSGTSMTMRLLEFGGMEIVVDKEHRKELRFNKYGVLEPGKFMDGDIDMTRFAGKGIKTFSDKVLFGTPKFKYKIIMPVRDPEEVALSKKQAFNFTRAGLLERIKVELELKRLIIKNRDDMELLEIPYNDYFLKTDEVCQKIADFLEGAIDPKKASLAVDKTLFKIRKQ